jgi:hypothetical protein
MASNAPPYYVGPTHAPPVAAQRETVRGAHLALLVAGAAVFVASAAALVLPSLAGAARIQGTTVSAVAPSAAASAPAALSAADLERVLAYASTVRPDDSLVQVRPGVFAKRSNVHGVVVGDRTVYYDVQPHQSFGPLRSGALAESDVDILGRQTVDGTQVVVYAPKR